MTPIMLSDDLRIIDMDKLQYAIQRRSTSKDKDTGEVTDVWQSVDFCTAPKSLVQSARERLGNAAADKARAAMHKAFDAAEIKATILKLPKKGKR